MITFKEFLDEGWKSDAALAAGIAGAAAVAVHATADKDAVFATIPAAKYTKSEFSPAKGKKPGNNDKVETATAELSNGKKAKVNYWKHQDGKYTYYYYEPVDKLKEDTGVDTALENKSKSSGIDKATLKAVFDRGSSSHRREHRSGSSVAWAMARVNAFISGGKARDADKDLWDKRKKVEKS